MAHSKVMDRVGVASAVRMAVGAPERGLSRMPEVSFVHVASCAAVGVGMLEVDVVE